MSNSALIISIFEMVLILIIVGVQCYVAIITWKKIRAYQKFLPNKDNVSLKTYYLDAEEMCKLNAEDIMSTNEYILKGRIEERQEETKIKLISINDGDSAMLEKAVTTINNYLLKNQDAASDFGLIKDVVERNCDTADDEISQRLPVPLYLGLMGTVLGIIVGLFSLPSDVTSELFYQSIGGLLSSIKFAMICSFFGLLLTTVLTAWLYRAAKTKLEEQKNDFYSFIQMEIMPTMTENATSTILAMQKNLTAFNSSFKQNIENFHGVMDNIENAFDNQVEMVRNIKDMDIAKIANLNVKVLKQLSTSMTELEKFNQYLGLMNSFVHNTAQLNDSISEQLKRTGAVEDIIGSLSENIHNNRTVMTMLEDFLAKVDANEALKHSSATLDNTLSIAIDEIKGHVQSQVNELKKYTSEATARLGDFVKIAPARNENLDQNITVSTNNKDIIEALATLNSSLSKNIEASRQEIESLKSSKTSLLATVCLVLITFFMTINGLSNCVHKVPSAVSNTGQDNSYNGIDTTVDTTYADTATVDTAVSPF